MTKDAPRVLLVEDDKPLRATLAATFKAEGYAVVEAGSVTSAKQRLGEYSVDLAILDLGLPDQDGLTLLADMRTRGDLTPIIVLTARDDEASKVRALDLGADDYVTKPFGVAELLARARSALRHGIQVRGAAPVVRTGHLEIDLSRRVVTRAGELVKLSRKEFDLLAELALNIGKPVPHERLLEAVWGSVDADIRYLRVYIGQLREKVEIDPQGPTLISADAGYGYRLNQL
ncbi:MAG: response regulator transcription factor [Caulobacteraceae bacterium]|nr:response regulator transcription factor [Caulobacteraceae bacterium]